MSIDIDLSQVSGPGGILKMAGKATLLTLQKHTAVAARQRNL